MVRRLVNALGAAARTAGAFSDEATLRHMLRFEAALAHAAAGAGLIPAEHAPSIVEACDPALYDPVTLAASALRLRTSSVRAFTTGTVSVAVRRAASARVAGS